MPIYFTDVEVTRGRDGNAVIALRRPQARSAEPESVALLTCSAAGAARLRDALDRWLAAAGKGEARAGRGG
jgi:hypothetical protein